MTNIIAVKNPKLKTGHKHCEESMLFKLIRKTVIRLKDELLQIWNGVNPDKVFLGITKFPYYWEMTGDHRKEKGVTQWLKK
jgi:hypothetical protein